MKLRTALYNGHTELATIDDLGAVTLGTPVFPNGNAGEVVFVDGSNHAATSADLTFDAGSKTLTLNGGSLVIGASEPPFTLSEDSGVFQLGDASLTFNPSTKKLTIAGSGNGLLASAVGVSGGRVAQGYFDSLILGEGELTISEGVPGVLYLGDNGLSWDGANTLLSVNGTVDSILYKVGGTPGIDLTFTTADVPPKTVTVSKGIVTVSV